MGYYYLFMNNIVELVSNIVIFIFENINFVSLKIRFICFEWFVEIFLNKKKVNFCGLWGLKNLWEIWCNFSIIKKNIV